MRDLSPPVAMSLELLGRILDNTPMHVAPVVAAAGLAIMHPGVSVEGKWCDGEQESIALNLHWEEDETPDDAIRIAREIASAALDIWSHCDDTRWFAECRIQIENAVIATAHQPRKPN